MLVQTWGSFGDYRAFILDLHHKLTDELDKRLEGTPYIKVQSGDGWQIRLQSDPVMTLEQALEVGPRLGLAQRYLDQNNEWTYVE